MCENDGAIPHAQIALVLFTGTRVRVQKQARHRGFYTRMLLTTRATDND
jgi:hypothetical protein